MKISDSGPAPLPSWLTFQNFTFIGFPVQQDNIKFISIVINYNKHKTLRDVFLINGIDSGQSIGSTPKPANSKPTNFIGDYYRPNEGNCEIKLAKPFDTVEDLWGLIVYLMPKFLGEILTEDQQSTNLLKPSPNQAVTEWARDLFTVSGQKEADGRLVYNLLISNQPCARDLNDFDDLQYKLTKIGMQFNVIKNMQSTQESSADDDEDNQFFSPDPMLNDMPGKNRRQIKRLHHGVQPTPAVYSDWVSVSATNALNPPVSEDSTLKHQGNHIDAKDLTRLQPSLSTPGLPFSRTVNLYTSGDHNDLTTPHYPASILSNIYSTPSYAPEPPTDFYLSTDASLVTPTPTLTFIVSDTAREFSSLSSSNLESIAPSSTLDVIASATIQPDVGQPNLSQPDQASSSAYPATDHKIIQPAPTSPSPFNVSIDELFRTTSTTTTTTTTTTTPKPAPKKPKVMVSPDSVPDHAPIIRERIPKLRLTSGVYFSYVIPEDTFTDFEKGNTRNLKLSFAPIDKHAENIAPADLFIQFDNENQILTALPTEVIIQLFTKFLKTYLKM